MEHLIKKYCKAWNNLNISKIVDDLHDDIEHHSQVILEVLKGKPKVIDNLEKKFSAIKSLAGVGTCLAGVWASTNDELAY